MASTYNDFISAICPLLANSPLVDIYVEMASLQTGATFFEDKYDYALALRASHLFTIDNTRKNGIGGLVTGQTEGRTSISYWNSVDKGDSSNLSATTYGQRLKALISSIGAGVSIGATGVL